MTWINASGEAGGRWLHWRLAVLTTIALWLAACAPLAPQPDPEPDPDPPEAVATPLSPALLALLDRAAEATAAGDLDDAAAAVERALRLAPEEPELWYRLAEVRFAQGDWAGAEAMALRAIDRDRAGVWRRASWQLIAEARLRAGDREGARETEARLRIG